MKLKTRNGKIVKQIFSSQEYANFAGKTSLLEEDSFGSANQRSGFLNNSNTNIELVRGTREVRTGNLG